MPSRRVPLRAEQQRQQKKPRLPASAPALGSWEEPGNFHSRLSALIWVAHLVIFADAYARAEGDDLRAPALLEEV
jgi:hypothetical protein